MFYQDLGLRARNALDLSFAYILVSCHHTATDLSLLVLLQLVKEVFFHISFAQLLCLLLSCFALLAFLSCMACSSSFTPFLFLIASCHASLMAQRKLGSCPNLADQEQHMLLASLQACDCDQSFLSAHLFEDGKQLTSSYSCLQRCYPVLKCTELFLYQKARTQAYHGA